MTNNYLEIVERGYTGEQVTKDFWDVDMIAIKTAEIVAEYGFSRGADEITTVDDALLERYYEAGRKLLVETGVYNIDTRRVIKLSAEEIDDAAKNTKKTLTMGEGKDAFTLYAREPEDARKPGVWAGNPGCPTPERLFLPTVRSWTQEKVVDLITCGSIVDVDGYAVRSAEPSEVLAVRRELSYLHQAAAFSGRPGIGMLAGESSVSEIGDLSATAPGALRPCDSHLVALLNELIISRDNMVRAASSIDTGVRNASLACVMVGGLAGGAPGAVICMIASMLAANIVCRADYHLCHPIHINYIATSTRECMWLQSVVCQAFAKCAPAIIVCDIYPKSGALTKELLYEVAANALAITVSGGHLEGCGSCDGVKPHGTGLEVRVMGETGLAASRQGISRAQANDIILKLLAKYEHVMDTGNEGKPFDEAYDMQTITPVPQWEQMYQEVKAELAEMGLNL